MLFLKYVPISANMGKEEVRSALINISSQCRNLLELLDIDLGQNDSLEDVDLIKQKQYESSQDFDIPLDVVKAVAGLK